MAGVHHDKSANHRERTQHGNHENRPIKKTCPRLYGCLNDLFVLFMHGENSPASPLNAKRQEEFPELVQALGFLRSLARLGETTARRSLQCGSWEAYQPPESQIPSALELRLPADLAIFPKVHTTAAFQRFRPLQHALI